MKALKFVIVPTLAIFGLWNLSKIPAYFEFRPMNNVTYDAAKCENPELDHYLGVHQLLNQSIELRPFGCTGMQNQWNLYVMFGIKSPFKLFSDVENFLIPHCAMGVVLEVLLILALLQGSRGLYDRSKFFLPLAAVFAIHILPVAKGAPDSMAGGAPINEVLVAVILVVCLVGAKGMRDDFNNNGQMQPREKHAGATLITAWVVIGILINIAPVGEWVLMISNWGYDPPKTEDHPHPESGSDFYAGLKCPWIGKIACMFLMLSVFMYGFEIYAAARGESWRSPFSRNGPAIWQIFQEPAPGTDRWLFLRPETFLEATGECFVMCMGVSWVITAMFNPGIFQDNILRSIVGYNNLCVGFDSPPARYVAMPMLVLQAVLASRYSYLDTIRLRGTRDQLTFRQFWFAYCSNWVFALHMMCFPMLLVITADFMSWETTKIHLLLFMVTLVIMWMMIAGNVYEAPELELDTKIWFSFFTAHTFLLPVAGVINVLGFGKDVPADQIHLLRYEKPHPPVPWPITAYLDYGWFLLLLLTVIFLPKAPPVKTRFHCSYRDSCDPEDTSEEYSQVSTPTISSMHSVSSFDSDVIGKKVDSDA